MRLCATQFLMAIEMWNCNVELQLYNEFLMLAIYFDFKKAIDLIHHIRVLTNLKAYGIWEKLFDWVQSFLIDNKQRVMLTGTTFPWAKVMNGMPHGLALGLLLFLILLMTFCLFSQYWCLLMISNFFNGLEWWWSMHVLYNLISCLDY